MRGSRRVDQVALERGDEDRQLRQHPRAVAALQRGGDLGPAALEVSLVGRGDVVADGDVAVGLALRAAQQHVPVLVVDLLPPHRHDEVVVAEAALMQSRARRGRAASEHDPSLADRGARPPTGRAVSAGDAHPPVGHRRASLRRARAHGRAMQDAGSSPSAGDASRSRSWCSRSIVAFVAMFSVWVNRQVLNTDNWTATSSQLLEQQGDPRPGRGLPRRRALRQRRRRGRDPGRAAAARPAAGRAGRRRRAELRRARRPRGARAPARPARLGGRQPQRPRAADQGARGRRPGGLDAGGRRDARPQVAARRRRRRASASAAAWPRRLPDDAAEITILRIGPARAAPRTPSGSCARCRSCSSRCRCCCSRSR